MQIDAGMATLVSAVVLAVVGIAFGYGMLTNRVKGNRLDIDENKRDFNHALGVINEKLDRLIRNGRGGAD